MILHPHPQAPNDIGKVPITMYGKVVTDSGIGTWASGGGVVTTVS